MTGEILHIGHLEPSRDLLRSHAALTGKIKQIRELFRTGCIVVLTRSSPTALRDVFLNTRPLIVAVIAGVVSMQFDFDRVPDQIEGFVNPGL